MVRKSRIIWLGTNDGIQTEIDKMNKEGYELESIRADGWQKYDDKDGYEITDAERYILHFKQCFADKQTEAKQE